MSSATEILRHAQACVASQRLHEAFASFCQARDLLSNNKTTTTSKRVLQQVHNEVDRMAAYLKQDPYTCLGVDSKASDKTIKKAYRNMARTYHPDKNKHTQQLFILVKDAYEILSNPSERAKLNKSSSNSSNSNSNRNNRGRNNHNRTNQRASSTTSSSSATPDYSKMSAEEMFKARRKKEAQDLAERKKRHMEMKRKKDAAAKRRRDIKAAEARKQREALLQQQMQEQIKRAWQFVQQQQAAENDQGVSFTNANEQNSNSQSIGSKLDSIRQRVLEKMNEIRERAGEKEETKDKTKDKKTKDETENEKDKEKKERDKIWKERRQRVGEDKKAWKERRSNVSNNQEEKNKEEQKNKAEIKKQQKKKKIVQPMDDGIRVRTATDADGIRVRSGTDVDGVDGIRVRNVPPVSNDPNNYSTSNTVAMDPPDESVEEIGSFFSSTMGVSLEKPEKKKNVNKTKTKTKLKKRIQKTTTEAAADLSAAALKLYQDAKRKARQAEKEAKEASQEAAEMEKTFKKDKAKTKLNIKKEKNIKKEMKEKEIVDVQKKSLSKSTINNITASKIKKSSRLPAWKTIPVNKKTTSTTSTKTSTKTIKSTKSSPSLTTKKKKNITTVKEGNNTNSVVSAKNARAMKKTSGITDTGTTKSMKSKKVSSIESLPPVQTGTTNTTSKSSNKESSFIEEVRNMWRTAVLDAVGMGTDAKFLKKLGISHDDDERPESDVDTKTSSPRSSLSTPRLTPRMKTPRSSLDTNNTSNIILGAIKPTSFASNVQRFPCKRCGITITIDAMIEHANVCIVAVASVPLINLPPSIIEDPVVVAARKSARRRASTSSSATATAPSKNEYRCQLCDSFVPVDKMVTHPSNCQGINPTGMFWGKDIAAPNTTPAISSTPIPNIAEEENDDALSSEGIATDDDEDDEPFLDGGGLNEAEDDFSRFAKTWRSRHTIEEVEEEHPSGFFTESGAFVDSPAAVPIHRESKFYENEDESSEGIASSEDSDEELFSDDDDDDEPLVADESELERVLRDGIRFDGATLVFA